MSDDTRKNSDLCAIVREKILQYIIEANKRGVLQLPPEKRLSEVLQVSRGTVRTVLSTLEFEGKISRRHGSGTFINPQALEFNTTLFPQVYFNDLIRLNGYIPTIEIIDAQLIEAGDIGEKLDIAPNRNTIKVRKIYRADGEVCICCIDYLNAAHFHDPQQVLKALQTEPVSIFQVLKQHTNLHIVWDILHLKTQTGRLQEFQSYIARPEDFLAIDVMNYNDLDRPILFSISFLNTEMLDLFIVRGRYPIEDF